MVRIILISASCLGMTSALGQQDAVSSGNAPTSSVSSAPTAASPIAPGIYRGDVAEKDCRARRDGRQRSSEFDLDLSKNPGTLRMLRAARPCNGALAITITDVKEGVARLEQSGFAPGGIVGCDRVFELTVSGNSLSGVMTGPDGCKFDVKATKQ